MKSSFWLFFIIGIVGISLITIGILTYFKNNEPTTILKPEVLAVMKTSEEKRDQAQELLSQNEPSDADQKKAKELLKETLDEAIQATKLQPNNPQTWLFLGKMYEQLIKVNSKNAALAEEAVKKAIELTPENPKIYQELATIHIHQKKYKDAEEALHKAIELDPTDPNFYFKLGNVYKELGEKEQAKKNYLEARELTPDSHATNSAMIDVQLKSLEK